jgi:Right handed beta helix region
VSYGRIAAAALTGLGVVAALANASAAAPSTSVACGDTITVSTKLSKDLTCTGPGLTVGGKGITLDLGGHTVSGSDPTNGAIGVLVAGADATIVNGKVRDFDTGVELSSPATVRGVSAIGNFFGVQSTAGGRFLGNRLAENLAYGLYLAGCAAGPVKIAQNVVTRNGFGGLLLAGGSCPVTVSGNTVSFSGSFGITAIDAVVSFTGNTVSSNGDDGIFVVGEPTYSFGSNHANGNAALGIDAVPGSTDLGGNTASGNGDPRQCVGIVCS